MKSKAPLALMEQMVMLLVFALAAALCLQAFVKSDLISRRSDARDRAAALAQMAAEAIQSQGSGAALSRAEALAGAAELLGARYEQGLLWLDYDEDWNLGGDAYRLEAQGILTDIPGLREAVVRVVDRGGEEIFSIPIAWQGEVPVNG